MGAAESRGMGGVSVVLSLLAPFRNMAAPAPASSRAARARSDRSRSTSRDVARRRKSASRATAASTSASSAAAAAPVPDAAPAPMKTAFSAATAQKLFDTTHKANLSTLWWSTPPPSGRAPIVAAFVTGENSITTLDSMEATRIAALPSAECYEYFINNNLIPSSVVGASLQAHERITETQIDIFENLAAWVDVHDESGDPISNKAARNIQDFFPQGPAGGAGRSVATDRDHKEAAHSYFLRHAVRQIIEKPAEFNILPGEFFIDQDGDHYRSNFSIGKDSALNNVHQEALMLSYATCVNNGLLPCQISGFGPGEAPLPFLIVNSRVVMSEFEAAIAITSAISESVMNTDKGETRVDVAKWKYRWINGIAACEPTSVSLVPDISAINFALPTLKDFQSVKGRAAIRKAAVEVLIDQAGYEEATQKATEELNDGETLPPPMRPLFANNQPFEDVEADIFSTETMKIDDLASSARFAFLAATRDVDFSKFPNFLDEEGVLPSSRTSDPYLTGRYLFGRSVDIGAPTTYTDANELAGHIANALDEDFRSANADKLGRAARSQVTAATSKAPAPRPLSPWGPSDDAAAAAQFNLAPTKHALPHKDDEYADLYVTKSGMVAVQSHYVKMGMPHSANGWHEYDTSGTVFLENSWQMWSEGVYLIEVVEELSADNTVIVDKGVFEWFRPQMKTLNLLTSDGSINDKVLNKKITTLCPTGFSVFVYNSEDICEYPTTAKGAFIAVCSAAPRRKRLAAFALACRSELESRRGRSFTANTGWCRKIGADKNWADVLGRLCTVNIASAVAISEGSDRVELLQFERQVLAQESFSSNGKTKDMQRPSAASWSGGNLPQLGFARLQVKVEEVQTSAAVPTALGSQVALPVGAPSSAQRKPSIRLKPRAAHRQMTPGPSRRKAEQPAIPRARSSDHAPARMFQGGPALIAAANVLETPQLPAATKAVDQSTQGKVPKQDDTDPHDADVSSNEADYGATEADNLEDEAPANDEAEQSMADTADEFVILDNHGRRTRPVRVVAPTDERYDESEDNREQRTLRQAKVLSWAEVNELSREEIKTRNQRAEPMPQSEFRFDSYLAREGPEDKGQLFEICRAYNNALGQFWCRNVSERHFDAPGHSHENPLHACRAGGRSRVHVCCRCRQPGHPWSLCEANDGDLERSHFDFATKPPKPLDIREADNEARWEKYGIPADSKAPNKASSSRGW